MATGSFILHGATKKVGNLVTYKRDGKQIVRERATSVANPKSIGQASQRANFAPVAKFYSPLSVVLEKSYEGLSKAQSYSKFLKENIGLAKKNGWFLPKNYGFFPLPYELSSGTIRPLQYEMLVGTDALKIVGTEAMQDAGLTTIGGLSQVFIALGYSVGDQITVIVVKSDAERTELGSNFWPEFTRFIIAPDSTEPANFPGFDFSFEADDGIEIISNDTYSVKAGAIIVSRYQNKVWRRSTQFLAVNDVIADFLVSLDNKEVSIASYRQASGDIQSDVYLNGSTYEGSEAQTGASIQLSDGTAFTPRQLMQATNYAWVNGTVGTGDNRRAVIKLGVDYLLTSSTKGAISQEQLAGYAVVDGTQPDMKSWLMSQGVAASVF